MRGLWRSKNLRENPGFGETDWSCHKCLGFVGLHISFAEKAPLSIRLPEPLEYLVPNFTNRDRKEPTLKIDVISGDNAAGAFIEIAY
jgi:hypothetical protein